MASTAVFSLCSLVFYVAVVLFASIYGRKAERLGAALLAGNMALTWTAQAAGDAAPFYAFMVVDFATALGLGVLTIKNPEKLWPGVSACAQLLIFVFSATRALQFPLGETSYLVMLNLSSLLCVGALAVGTWAGRWRTRPASPWEVVTP